MDINQSYIKSSLPVTCEEMCLEEAKESNATGVFVEKYEVYSIGDFSKKICGGPHVETTSKLGHFKIIKEESATAGVRRIKAIVE